MTPEEIEKIPYGTTYDKHHNIISFKNDSWWYKYDYVYRDGVGYFSRRYRDWNGYDLFYECDHNCNEIFYKNGLSGDWYRLTRNENGQILTKETQHGIVTYLAHDGFYGLTYDDTTGKYMAGCRCFWYEDAVIHWSTRSKSYDLEIKYRAKLFLDAIENHHDYLNS